MSDIAPAPRSVTLTDLAGVPQRHRRESLIRYVLFGAALFSVLISTLIVYALFSEAWVFMREIDWGVTWGEVGWFPRRGIYDMPTLLIASAWVTGIAMVVAGPIGLGAAVYLSEYASPRARRILKPILEVLAGIPSVVLGFFALSWIAPQIVANIGGEGGRGSIMAAGIAVGVLTIPLVASISEDAMKAVPDSLREASAGMEPARSPPRCGSCSRPRSPAWWRRSSSPSPVPSARRWWCSWPVVPPTPRSSLRRRTTAASP